MNAVKTTAVLLWLGCFSVIGCDLSYQKPPLSSEAEACREQIAVFRSNVGLDGVKLVRECDKVGEQTLSLTNAQERIELFRAFVTEFYKIDISKCTVREAERMIGNYYPNTEYLAYGLIRAGGSKEEAWQSLVTGLERYKQMCFAYGDENDMSDGMVREAFDRRKVARWGRKSWKGCLLFCRDHTIKSVFGPDNKDTIERLQARLEKKFGKIEERRTVPERLQTKATR